MTNYFPIAIDHEESGAWSAYVIGLPVYAAADTRREAKYWILKTLKAYLKAHPEQKSPEVTVQVARVKSGKRMAMLSAAALVGASTSPAKARSSRKNGRLGGRPRRRR